MKISIVLPAVAVALVLGAAPSLASAPSSDIPGTDTADSCIALNQGDWNACNVGNGGRGDLPYTPITSTRSNPNECIKLNQGDWTACNVGH
ncbi:MAG: hypothetical protein QOJ62_316 [Actinomycetota bacterium]|nr:hypothetical protein [Actinomycetota bacterium]